MDDKTRRREMNKEFTREARYVVLKNADIMQCLTINELIELRYIQARVEEYRAEIGKPQLDCIVLESDRPEHEPTWRAIEARVTGAQQAPDGSAVLPAARIMNIELIRERDALRAEIEELHALIAAVKKQANAEFCLRVKKEEECAQLRAKIEGGSTTVIVSKFPVNPTDAPLYALPGAQTQGEEE